MSDSEGSDKELKELTDSYYNAAKAKEKKMRDSYRIED